jgi:hypothetical protein
MRGRVVVAFSVASMALGAGLVACVDLFHSTTGILDACDLDVQTKGCPEASAPVVEASVDAGGGTDFCAWSSAEARLEAQHACAWLGACESPLGNNAFGTCVFQALLAYDCASNPNHRVHGKAHDLWDCLWRTKSCDDVHACVFAGATVQCNGSNGTACIAGGANASSGLRVECVAGGAPRGENCGLWAQTCATDGTQGVCAGAASGLSSCSGESCSDRQVHSCNAAGRDIGIDCSENGAGQCNGFPPGSSQWVACIPEGDSGTCGAGSTPTCAGGVALPCPTGAREEIDCQTLLQPGDASSACNPQSGAPAFDWTSACVVEPPVPPCDGDGGDYCMGDAGLASCARGVPFTVDCNQQGLGRCQMMTTDLGSAQHAACSPP